MKQRQYIAIDLKSFYASVECVERGLNPLDTLLVVADESRTQKTICLAVSPSLKAYGTGSRPRLFEVVQKVRDANLSRGNQNKSFSAKVLAEHPEYAIDYIVALPRMTLYIDYSTRIYEIYMRFIAPEDIHVYSIDEVFIDATAYLETYGLTAHDLALKIIRTIHSETGITATAGIGTNMYLCKVAMDIMAKKMSPDKDGVRIAELDETNYRHHLWNHEPLTDFWRVGRGISDRLASYGIYTMGDIARLSVNNENLLYKLFGVNAELLIDHAWGWEPVTMAQVKSYRPESRSMNSGQVLHGPYAAELARNVVIEMADAVSYELLEQRILTDQVVLTVGYDVESLKNEYIRSLYTGKIKIDHFGRKVPTHAQGTININPPTSSSTVLIEKVGQLYDKIINPNFLVKRLTLSLNNLIPENRFIKEKHPEQLELFTDYEELNRIRDLENKKRTKERMRQEAILTLKQRFGKNVILKGINFAPGATQRDRNKQIGGHKA